MKNYLRPGTVLNYTNAGSLITSGSVVVSGSLVGIAVTDIANGATGSLNLDGVYELTSSLFAAAQGSPVLYDTVAKNITATANTNTKFIGTLTRAALSGDTTVHVRLASGTSSGVAATVAANATTNASDLATAITLVNSLKTTVNNILTNLKAAGLMAS